MALRISYLSLPDTKPRHFSGGGGENHLMKKNTCVETILRIMKSKIMLNKD